MTVVHYAQEAAALPRGSVIRDADGRIFVWLDDGDFFGWYTPGQEASEAAAFFTYPATVLFRGDESVHRSDASTSALPTFPAWTGTEASARMIADRVRKVDEWAEVDTDRTPGFSSPMMFIDTVPNRITLKPGDRPVFNGERWSVERAPEEVGT